MNVIKTSFALAAIAVLGILFAAAANATPVKYDFTVTATSGPLDGTVSHGTFSFDSSSVTPGTWSRATGLLTAFDFTWNGTTYNAATANTGTLSFDGAGHLTDFMFGTHCSAGECSFAVAPETWFAWSDAFFYSLPTGRLWGWLYHVLACRDLGTRTRRIGPVRLRRAADRCVRGSAPAHGVAFTSSPHASNPRQRGLFVSASQKRRLG